MVGYYEGRVLGGIIMVPRTTAIDALRAEVTAAGSAGSLLRLLVYAITPEANTATLVVNGGTIDATVTGIAAGTFAPVTLLPGMYVLGVRLEGGATTKPTVRGLGPWASTANPWVPVHGSFMTAAAGANLGYSAAVASTLTFNGSGDVVCPLANMRIAP